MSYHPLFHPGGCFGYKFQIKNKSIIYATDNELTNSNKHLLYDFFSKADILIHDAFFLNEKREDFVGWGHSFVQDVLDIASHTNVKDVRLFHHIPTRPPAFFTNLQKYIDTYITSNSLSCRCSIAKEGDIITF